MHGRILAVVLAAFAPFSLFAAETPSAWPREHAVVRDDAAGRLTVSTPYYIVTHDLRAGGAIAAISYPNGRAANLLLAPIGAWIEDAGGVRYTDCRDAAARVSARTIGAGADSAVVVTAEGGLADAEGRACAVRITTTYEHRWGYIKIRKEFAFPAEGVRVADNPARCGRLAVDSFFEQVCTGTVQPSVRERKRLIARL